MTVPLISKEQVLGEDRPKTTFTDDYDVEGASIILRSAGWRLVGLVLERASSVPLQM